MGSFLKDKVVIVTGASSGMGVDMAIQLAREGAKVVMAARREEKLKEVQTTIMKEGGNAIAIKTDISNREEVKQMVAEAEKRFGPVDILVSNAAVAYHTMMRNAEEDRWNEMVDINIKGVLNCIGAVVPGMVQRRRGHIICISSEIMLTGFLGLAVYSGTKWFQEGLCETMRDELWRDNVKVTCIRPGDTKSEIGTQSTDKEALQMVEGKDIQYLEGSDVGRAVVYVANQPDHVAINLLLIQPTKRVLMSR